MDTSRVRVLLSLLAAWVVVLVGGYSVAGSRSNDSLACVERLDNGGFDTGAFAPWAASGAIGIGLGRANLFGARLGGYPGSAAWLEQSLAIPAGAQSAWLSFWWLVDNHAQQPGDLLRVSIVQGSQTIALRSYNGGQSLNLWQQEVVDLSAYVGRTIKLTFEVHNHTSNPGAFRLDDVSVLACAIPVRPTATPTRALVPSPTSETHCVDLVLNGDFESRDIGSWNGIGPIYLAEGHESPRAAWLGGATGQTAELWQRVTIPANVNSPVLLRYWWRVEASQERMDDYLRVLVEEYDQVHLLHTWYAVGPFQWRQGIADVSAFVGRDVVINFTSQNGGGTSRFIIDGVSLIACLAEGTPTATPTRQSPGPTPTFTRAPGAAPGLYLPLAKKAPTPAYLVVNTTDDTDDGACTAGHCSLREAIQAANQHIGPDTIAFNIPASDPGRAANGVCTIRPQSPLPPLYDDETTLDGFTQAGAVPNTNPFGQPINAILKIVLDGSQQTSYMAGVTIYSGGNQIRGLVIHRFYEGVLILNADNNVIEGCFIGTDVQGALALGNDCGGVSVIATEGGRGSHGNVIGGSWPGARNLISGNSCSGVQLGPAGQNRVLGNYIGTNANGTAALPNNGDGVYVFNVSSQNVIGGPGPGDPNLIAYNRSAGVSVFDSAASSVITRNRIHSHTGKGIRLVGGGNGGLAAPVITASSWTRVAGTACANCVVEVFSDQDDEGAIYEGSATANASGQWELVKPQGFSGPHLTATATDGAGHTSEFSVPVVLD